MIEILKFEMINKGSLIARFSAKMHKWGGLLIRDCTLFESGDKKWINLPSKQYEAEGKKKYFAYLAYEDRALDDKLKENIMRAALEYKDKMAPTPVKSRDEAFDEMPF